MIDIKGGSALIYDDPVDNSVDFCFARFADVSAQALQTHIERIRSSRNRLNGGGKRPLQLAAASLPHFFGCIAPFGSV